MKTIFSLIAALLLGFSSFAQEEKDRLIPADTPLTWLGIDITQMRLIASHEVTPDEIRNKFAPAWNQLFVDELKKYDVAKYTHRQSVEYALEVTGKANKKIGDDLYSSNPDDFHRLGVGDITKLVNEYDFQDRKGMGLMIVVEALDKSKTKASAWVVVVDMDKKSVIATRRETASAGGFGFRNYWAKSFLGILQDAGH
jgi:hypothetical protein